MVVTFADTVIGDLPPSASAVALALHYEGPLNSKELADYTGMPPRTIRYAVTQLLECEVVDKRTDDRDARRDLYTLEIEG